MPVLVGPLSGSLPANFLEDEQLQGLQSRPLQYLLQLHSAKTTAVPAEYMYSIPRIRTCWCQRRGHGGGLVIRTWTDLSTKFFGIKQTTAKPCISLNPGPFDGPPKAPLMVGDQVMVSNSGRGSMCFCGAPRGVDRSRDSHGPVTTLTFVLLGWKSGTPT